MTKYSSVLLVTQEIAAVLGALCHELGTENKYIFFIM
jgi:hypothetical protein